MSIKQGDIVGSNGRIATKQDGRQRYAEFEGALVLATDGSEITVNPLGKKAKLVCDAGDLISSQQEKEPEPEPTPQPDAEPEPTPKPKAKPATSLKSLMGEGDKPTAERKQVVNKPPARRRRKSQ